MHPVKMELPTKKKMCMRYCVVFRRNDEITCNGRGLINDHFNMENNLLIETISDTNHKETFAPQGGVIVSH